MGPLKIGTVELSRVGTPLVPEAGKALMFLKVSFNDPFLFDREEVIMISDS